VTLAPGCGTRQTPALVGTLKRSERITLAIGLLATIAAGVSRYAGAPAVLGFLLAAIALAALASIVSFATEQVGERFGPAVTGFLQSTLGNLPEFFIVVFALSAGQVVVAQTSIIGSLFANALLVLGLVIVTGAAASKDGIMRFRIRLPNDTATLLLAASFVIVVVGIAVQDRAKAASHVQALSAIAAVGLLAIYATWGWGYLRSDTPSPEPEREAEGEGEGDETQGRRAPIGVSVALLAVAGAGAAFASDWFIHALQPAIASLGISQAFAGLVIVAIAGNAVENVAGIALAHKGQSDLAISVVKNSVAQVAAFLFPALVLVSLLFPHALTFALNPVYIGAIALTALALWQITGDGEATAFEGVALIALYVVLGTFAFLQ
jgi:Ca2+:H+ antiporter